jgi:hypothetical protein
MALSHESQEFLARIRTEVENAIGCPSGWVLDRIKEVIVGAILKSAFNQAFAETVGKMIAEAFSERLVLAVAQEFHRIAADEVAQGMQRLAYEVAALRRAVRRDLDEDDWWKQGPTDADEQDGGQTPPNQ